MNIPVFILVGLVAGAAIGAYRAKKRGGRPLDMLQYAATHAIPLMILGLFLTIVFDRSGF